MGIKTRKFRQSFFFFTKTFSTNQKTTLNVAFDFELVFSLVTVINELNKHLKLDHESMVLYRLFPLRKSKWRFCFALLCKYFIEKSMDFIWNDVLRRNLLMELFAFLNGTGNEWKIIHIQFWKNILGFSRNCCNLYRNAKKCKICSTNWNDARF